MTETKEKKPKRGRKIIAAVMVAVLGCALFVNWLINSAHIPLSINATTTQSDEQLGQAQYVNATTAKTDYFKESRLKREKTADNTLKELNAVIDSENATSDEKKSAIDTYSKLSERKALENDIETLVCAKGVSESIVVLGDKSCEVIVPEAQLNDALALQIKEIVTNKADISAEKISVSGAK